MLVMLKLEDLFYRRATYKNEKIYSYAMDKRGAGNIEFVMAFILFIGFTSAVLYFFNPIGDKRGLESSRDYILNEIIKNTSVVLDSYSVIINQAAPPNVIIEIAGANPKKNVNAVDYNGKKLDVSRLSGDNFCINRENRDFATLHFSEDIEMGQSLNSCNSGNYQIASFISDSVISEKRILDLNSTYYSDYNSLKEQLNIPNNIEFTFSLEFQGGERILALRNPPAKVEIFSDSKIKEILRKNGALQFGRFTVSIW